MLISNKLITLLKTLSKPDLNQLEKYLTSPFFNENEDLIRLFEYINKFLRTRDQTHIEQNMEKVYIWQQLFAKKKYDDVKMRRLTSDLNKLVLSFIAYKGFKNTPQSEFLYLLNSLSNSGLNKQYEGLLKQAETAQKKSPLRDSNYHYNQFVIQQNRYRYTEKNRGNFLSALEKTDHELDCFYFSKKLKNICDAMSYEQFLSHQIDLKKAPGLLEYIEENGYLQIPGIKVYFLVAKMLSSEDGEPYFYQLKDFIHQYDHYFSKSELNTLFVHLKNYCIVKKINTGKQEFHFELFSLYQISLEKEIIIDKNNLDLHHYKNIITIGLLLKEYDWVTNFIKEYTHLLQKEHRENALTYNLAKVYFSQKRYHKVIEHLRAVPYKNKVYALGGKLILLKTYYELKEYIALDSLIDSFRIYIRRNKLISREVKQQYLNMLRFVKKLSGILPGDQQSIEKIQLQIDKCKALAGKKWILEKIEELK